MKLMQIWRDAEHDPPWTWAGHGWVTVMVPAVVAALLVIFLAPNLLETFLTYWFGVTAAGLFYARREYKDELAYRAKGTYRDAQGVLTAAVDKTGDSLGPYTAWAAVTTTGLLLWTTPWLTMGAAVLTFVFLVIAMFASARKVRAARVNPEVGS